MSDWDTVTYIGKRHTGGTTRHASEADVNRARRTGTEIDTAKKCTLSRWAGNLGVDTAADSTVPRPLTGRCGSYRRSRHKPAAHHQQGHCQA